MSMLGKYVIKVGILNNYQNETYTTAIIIIGSRSIVSANSGSIVFIDGQNPAKTERSLQNTNESAINRMVLFEN